MSEQPMPKRSKANKPVCVEAQKRFNALMVSQRMVGESDYGVPLTTFNGRSAFVDLMTEIADAVHYATQAQMEREEIVRRAQRMALALRLMSGPSQLAMDALAAWDELGMEEKHEQADA